MLFGDLMQKTCNSIGWTFGFFNGNIQGSYPLILLQLSNYIKKIL